MSLVPGSQYVCSTLLSQVQENVQKVFDSAPKYYIEKYMSRAGFNNDNYDIPTLDNSNPSLNDYLERIEFLKEKTASINNRIVEIRQLREEMRNAVHLVKDYEHKEKILKEGQIFFGPTAVRQYILNEHVVNMNGSQANEEVRKFIAELLK
ncbi:hypothetical protein ROZALSC1DRAFT_26325 [Rozella allomycis CSF55]|nr:hypothetical protein ROZALSC1DRAFT_26325 [Rozella allomycis CSF55]